MNTRLDPVPPYGFDTADEWSETFEEACPEVPEDDAAHRLAGCYLEELSADEMDLYEERILPLLRVAYFEPYRLAEEYAERRSPGYYERPHDDRQLELFAA
ncbi:hypothetical protein [Mesorhizobium opportunistum]|uniref:hypothetical protein n=1 Tax=Mesorhizobium opportunistum TaxID=593909 RepID=UPI0012372CE6|nr:hypothetical protein [Mesorhizobium opportunistum]